METKIAVIGLGYVGLPLARLFSTKYETIGFDINKSRVDELMNGVDSTLEVSNEQLRNAIENHSFVCTSDIEKIRDCNFYIITVPTPVDKYNRPDLTPLIKASATVGKVIAKNNIVVYESTVFPGATEENCIPIVENESGLKLNIDFFAGYSPERINPGDKEHTVEKIKKVTSGSTPEVGRYINEIYSAVIVGGTYLASSIKVAEAAKVIENSQRDINIAFVNELSRIFNLMNIDTNEVLEAAGTKWNFLPFKPGLVGGHCIGVDPYYLAQKAQEYGYHPEIILAGRRMNDTMGEYVASQIVKCMIRKGQHILNSNVLILGITFKENCPDVRNTKVINVIKTLKTYGVNVVVYDPWADKSEVEREYGIDILTQCPDSKFNAVVLAVAHDKFKEIDIRSLIVEDGIIYDVKGALTIPVDGRL